MEASLVSYGSITEGVRRSLSHMSSRNVITASADKLFSSVEQTEAMISLCPSHELLAVVSGGVASFYIKQKIVRQSSTGSHEHNMFVLNWDGMLPIVKDWSDERPAPTALECISLHTKSEDFSVVAVGFSDGYLRCYSHDGRLILSQQLHKSRITSLSTTSPIKVANTIINQAELLVVSHDVLIVVEGPSLVATVLSCKDKDLTKEQDIESVSDLVYKKWKLDKQRNTTSIACISKTTPPLFDSLVETSLIGKYDMPVKGNTPLGATKVISTGQHPMIGIFHITKDLGPPLMSEMLSAVTNKLTSAVMSRVNLGWLGWGSSGQDSSSKAKQVHIQPTASLPMSCNLHDQNRAVDNIVVSPCGRLATAVDSYGRILLVDTQQMLITKMWKGYRGAQCGWLVVDESSIASGDSTCRQALCLCIYLSKRGLLELWPVQRGPKVTSFNVGKGCRLLYTGNVVFNNATPLSSKASVVLLTASGQLITVSVPFHLLLRTDSTMSRDLHLLSTLPQMIANVKEEAKDDILEAVLTMLSLSVIDKAVRMLICSELLNDVKIPLIAKILSSVLSKLPIEYQKCMGGCGIRDYLERMKQLVQFYGHIDDMYRQEAVHALKSKLSVEDLESCASLNKQLSDNLTFCMNQYFVKYPVTSTQHEILTLDQFLKCFKLKEDLTQPLNISLESEEKYLPTLESPVEVFIKKLPKESLSMLGFTMFKGFMSIQASDKDVIALLLSTGIQCHTLLDVAVTTILSGYLAVQNEPYATFYSIAKLMKVLISLQAVGLLQFDDIFKQCVTAVLPGHALLLALHIIRYTAGVEACDDKSALSSGDGWETVSIEKERWFTLVNQSYTLTLLALLINSDSDLITVPLLAKAHPKAETIQLTSVEPIVVKDAVSVATVECYGSHVITSVVAHWLVTNHIPPEDYDASQLLTETASNWLIYLQKLCNELQFTLNRQRLLVHIIWDVVCTYGESQDSSLLHFALNSLGYLESSTMIEGCATLMWYGLFRDKIHASIDQLRKQSTFTSNFKECVSVARITLHTLTQVLTRTSSESLTTKELDQSYDIWRVHQLETEKLVSTRQNILSIADMIQSSPRGNIECVQLHYMGLLIMDIALSFDLFPIRIYNILGSQTKDSFGKELLHFDIGPLEKEGKRNILERTQKQFITKAVTEIISQANVREPITTGYSQSLSTWIRCCVHLSSLLGVGEGWCWCKYVYLLYAAGIYDRGEQEFMSLGDKSLVVGELLSLCGWKIIKLMSEMEASQTANLMAHLSPNILQWLRKQARITEIPQHFPVEQYTWQKVLTLLHTISSHCTPDLHGEIISQLTNFVQYCTST